jgi:hypothetical protein
MISVTQGRETDDFPDILKALNRSAAKVIDGDDKMIQEFLFMQLEVTNQLFNRLAGMMFSEGNRDLENFKTIGDLAAKFQNMSRRTAATLVDIKRPRQKTYIRQANVANHQQVNNSTNDKLSENEVSGGSHVETLDAGAETAAIGADTHLEAMGECNGAKDAHRQREVVHERKEDR